jgi:hypothetical protein
LIVDEVSMFDNWHNARCASGLVPVVLERSGRHKWSIGAQSGAILRKVGRETN